MSTSRLCQACGLCCDGTLFDVVPLVGEEPVPELLGVGLAPDGTRRFRQRCRGLEGTCCTVYKARPEACRGYVCLLHEALREDEVDVESALEIVARAKELIAAVEEAMPPRESDYPEETMRRARVLAAERGPIDEYTCAEAWLEMHFLGRRHPGTDP